LEGLGWGKETGALGGEKKQEPWVGKEEIRIEEKKGALGGKKVLINKRK
jgi:hypothetical protein